MLSHRQGLSNIAWALAKLCYEAPLMPALGQRVHLLRQSFDPQGLANVAWACATLASQEGVLQSLNCRWFRPFMEISLA